MQETMDGEPWNRVNILFPSAASTVHIKFTSSTATVLKQLLLENEKVLKLIRSSILQTEIRVLYALLYNLTNHFRGSKTIKALQQVEQCVNRLKNMKLCSALQDLADLCPNKIQMSLSVKSGECDVPSQPMLEWICLKVLGAGKLMSCTMARCSRAFLLSKQQMKCAEFIILNTVLTSMLSRLWVIFRGILVGLSRLYQNLLELLKNVAQAQPMPYLTDASLPADMAAFLGPSDALLLKKLKAFISIAKNRKMKQQPKKVPAKDVNQKQKRRIEEDLGVSVERGLEFDANIKPLFVKGKLVSEDAHMANSKQKLKKQIEEAATFSHMSSNLEEMIKWCSFQRKEKTKRLLSFLLLKCRRMKCLEAAGHNMQRKLRAFRQEVCWILSPRGSRAKRRTASLRSRPQSLKTRFVLSKIRPCVKKRRMNRQQKETGLPLCFNNYLQSKAAQEATLQITDSDGYDDIDDIFASAGL